jgi:arylsulfatase A-like enzyme
MQQWPDGKGCVQDSACLQCLTAAGSLGGKPSWKAAPCPSHCYPDGAVAVEVARQLTAYGEQAREATTPSPHSASSHAAGAKTQTLAAPFFLACGFKRPHLGWFGPQVFFDIYKNVSLPLAKHRTPPAGMPPVAFSGNGEICGMSDVTCVKDDVTGFKLVPEDKHLELRRAYASVVSFMDAQLGIVLDALDASGLAPTTAVVFWGDHGYQVLYHHQRRGVRVRVVWQSAARYDTGTGKAPHQRHAAWCMVPVMIACGQSAF